MRDLGKAAFYPLICILPERIAIARAIVGDPAILLLDEAVSRTDSSVHSAFAYPELAP